MAHERWANGSGIATDRTVPGPVRGPTSADGEEPAYTAPGTPTMKAGRTWWTAVGTHLQPNNTLL